MNTEGRQLRMVNRLTEADPEPKSDDVIEATNPKGIIKKGETVAKPEKKITGTPVDKVAVKRPTLKLVGPKNTEQAEAKAEGKAALKAARTPAAGEGPKMHAAKRATAITKKVP